MDCFIKLFHYSGFGWFSQSEPEETLGMGKYVNVVYMVKGCLEKSSLEGCTWEIPGVFLITTLDPHIQKFRGSLVERTCHTKVWRQSLLSTILSRWAPFYQKLSEDPQLGNRLPVSSASQESVKLLSQTPGRWEP